MDSSNLARLEISPSPVIVEKLEQLNLIDLIFNLSTVDWLIRVMLEPGS